MKNILSVFNVFSTIRIRLYPLINRLILKQNGAVVGCNVCISGKVHWQISKGGGNLHWRQSLFFIRRFSKPNCKQSSGCCIY